MDKDLDCYNRLIRRLDLRIDKLLKMRKNITLDMMYLIIKEESQPTGTPDDIMSKMPRLDKDTIKTLKNCDLS